MALVCLAATAVAEPRRVTIEFPDQGDRIVYLQKAAELGQAPVAPRSANGKSI